MGGETTTNCQFPSAVAILEDDETPVMCTGTLVHPNVVTFAAHCVNPERPVVAVGFGEEGQGEIGPVRVVPVDDCEPHPQYFQEGYPDIAYCTLLEPVLDVPRVPILAGCEVDVLQEDVEVTIVGFGATFGEYVGGELETEGVGLKRYTTQTIDLVELDEDEVHMVGPDGAQSACFGDSGGPALIEMSDGTWRVFGAASRLYDPGGFPDPKDGNFCGIGVTYGLLSTQLDWLESQSGYDLTPCHDADGQWAPSPECGDFPLTPQTGTGTWEEGCAGGELGGGAPLCSDAGGTTGGEETSSGGESSTGDGPDVTTGGAESSTGDATASTGLIGGTGGSDGGSTTTGDGLTSATMSSTGTMSSTDTSAGSASGGSEGSGSSGAGQDDAIGKGCGCRSGGGPQGAVLMLIGLFARRRRSAVC